MSMIIPQTDLWQTAANAKKPVLLYGMGDGADKILDACARLGVAVSGVFASDGFVRGQQFRGFSVMSYSAARERYGDFLALLCFASARPDVMGYIDSIAQEVELLAPDVPVYGGGLFTRDYALQNLAALEAARAMLADEQSRQCFDSIISYKITGEISQLRACESDRAQCMRELIAPHAHEHFVDAGAYNGDTVRELLSYTGEDFGNILALEPDRRNYKKLAAYMEDLGAAARCVPVAAWSEKATLAFAQRSGRQAALSDTGEPIPADSIDNLLEENPAGGASSVTLVKYDVEGAERQALLGSARTIEKHRPRLIVAAYHRVEDMHELIPLVKKLRPDYKIYLRRHPYYPAWDINLYCI